MNQARLNVPYNVTGSGPGHTAQQHAVGARSHGEPVDCEPPRERALDILEQRLIALEASHYAHLDRLSDAINRLLGVQPEVPCGLGGHNLKNCEPVCAIDRLMVIVDRLYTLTEGTGSQIARLQQL